MMHQHASKTPRARRAPTGRSAARTATSARKRAANRRNARASTGPRTAAGKARAAQNARRHGLSVAIAGNPTYAREVAAMADAIGRGLGPSLPSPPPMSQARYRHLVRGIAEAQIDVVRVRRARRNIHNMMARALTTPPAPQTLVPILADLLRQLAAVARYEGRALSRRRRAIRAFDVACAETESRGSGRERQRAGAFRRNKATARAVAKQSQQPGRSAGVSPAISDRSAGGTPALRVRAELAEQSQSVDLAKQSQHTRSARHRAVWRSKATAPVWRNKATSLTGARASPPRFPTEERAGRPLFGSAPSWRNKATAAIRDKPGPDYLDSR